MNSDPEYLSGLRIGRYVLVESLGRGGMGSVWKARQEEPIRRDVAIKFINPGMDTAGMLARFETERQVLARLDHPNIAAIFDAGSTDAELPYYVMELVDGEPITDYCRRHDLPDEQRLELFTRICRAVQYAHGKGVIHRDLKPGNILVAKHPTNHTHPPNHTGEARLKIIDFGIAKSMIDDFTRHSLCTPDGQLVGTPGYMSPEQVEGRAAIDGRADVYSLGALLYELLSGSPPFTRESLHGAGMLEVMRIIREEVPPKPSACPGSRAESAGDLDWITLRALSKDPTKRYDSPTALAEDIERHRNRQPVHASAPGLGTRIARVVRRRRALCIVAAVALVAGGAAFMLAKLNRPVAPPETQVKTLEDGGADSLRELVANAPEGAKIRFAPDLAGGTIRLAGSPLTVARSLSIDAGDTGITIDGGGESPLLVIEEATAVVELIGLTLTGGKDGAVISKGATLGIRRCTITRNGGAPTTVLNDAGGVLEMEGCLVSDNDSGGVRGSAGGETTLRNCTLANNRAKDSAAVHVQGAFRMINCTVTGNVASPDNFVPSTTQYPFMQGGAIGVHPYQHLSLEHCTIVGNSSPSCGGIHLWLHATIEFRNTIISGNFSTASEAPPDISCVQGGTDLYTRGGNFLGNNQGIRWHDAYQPDLRASLWQDQIGTPETPLDPMLRPLGDYGGPVPTMPPLPGSPVIDAVIVRRAPLATDARGVKRPIGEKFDIGAVELDPAR